MGQYEVFLKTSAVRDLDMLRKYDAATIADGLEKFLGVNPRKERKRRVKRLRGVHDPDYRLRVGEYRVFYSVDETEKRVDVLRVLYKDQTRQYYQEVQK